MPLPGITTQFQAAISAKVIRPCFLVSLQFKNETLNICTGLTNITFNGATYYGAGTLMSITGMGEDSQVTAKNLTVKVSGVPSEVISDVISESQRGLAAQIYLGLFESDGITLVPNPVLVYVGKMDQPTVTDNGSSCDISINIEQTLVDMNRPVYRRYTDVDQQLDYPGDLGCQFVPNLAEITMFFGSLPASINN